jgi:acyl-homoserine lactone acylase PvdQ
VRTASIALLLVLVAAAPAPAADGVRNILPPGQNGRANAVELGQFLSAGTRPPHNDDQLQRYADLLRAPRPFDEATLDRLFKPAPFGVPDGEAERTYQPRPDVTVTRDRTAGVPHIRSDSRDGAMFGLGYATAEDRLFFMDVFRHLGRAQLASFAGGAPANRAFDALMWANAPYAEEELTAQTKLRPPGFEAESDRIRQDLGQYLAGVNAYISQARLNPLLMPGEYAAIGRPQGPDPFTPADAVATAAVVGAIFGVGGGKEIESALALTAARQRLGRRRGTTVWRQFRSVDDPEAVTTVRGKRFAYGLHPKRPRGVAIPDAGSIELTELQKKAGGPGSGGGGARARGMSNALLVSARESASGRPLAVFGPQTAYFSPQVLIEQDVHAPGLDARGVAFPGINLYVQIGHGRDYAWSATTSAQDLVDTFAVPACDGDRGYVFEGRCEPIETLTRTNEWQPNAADPTPAGSETLVAQRTKLGLVRGRATVKGKPVLLVALRSTYGHEADSGVAFSRLNDPDRIRSPQDFQAAAALVPFTFNWFYIDGEHIAYQNAGANPIRAARTDGSLPISSAYPWRRWRPLGESTASLIEQSTPPSQHPSVVDQAWITDWNGKQARGYGAADHNWTFGPAQRQQLLAGRVRALTAGARRTTLPALTEAMADAATVDLRGDAVLPIVLRLLRGRARDVSARAAIASLEAWVRDGAHRLDRDGDGRYEHREAIQIMDAWWPRLVRAVFEPALGRAALDAIAEVNELDNHPNNHGDHLGSAWQYGWYGFVQKDVRRVLGRRVRGWPRVFCGARRVPARRATRRQRARCARAIARSLAAALDADRTQLYAGDAQCEDRPEPECFDAIWHRPLGGVTQPLIPWQNRPTFQQVVEIGGR